MKNKIHNIFIIFFILIGLTLGIMLYFSNDNIFFLIGSPIIGLILGWLLGNITTRGFEIKIGFKEKK